MLNKNLQIKVDRAIKLLRSYAPADGQPIEVAYSGGKDSDIILQLVKESGINYRAIYKNTTIDPPGTIAHVISKGVEIIRPLETFAQLIAKKGQPNRMRRFCCEKLKEYKVLDRAVIGVRAEESAKRAKRYQEPTQCRVYNKKERVEQVFPILDWTLRDIVEFAEDRNLTFAPVYYDEAGVLHPERRLGCMCCPLAYAKHRLEEFKKYPGMVKLYLRAIQKYRENHPQSKMAQTYTAYEAFAHDVFFYNKGQWDKVNQPDMFGNVPNWKQFLEAQFNIDLTL